MKKNTLIKKLQEFDGNPEVVIEDIEKETEVPFVKIRSIQYATEIAYGKAAKELIVISSDKAQ